MALVSLEKKIHTASDAGHALILSTTARAGRVLGANRTGQRDPPGRWHRKMARDLPTNSNHT